MEEEPHGPILATAVSSVVSRGPGQEASLVPLHPLADGGIRAHHPECPGLIVTDPGHSDSRVSSL